LLLGVLLQSKRDIERAISHALDPSICRGSHQLDWWPRCAHTDPDFRADGRKLNSIREESMDAFISLVFPIVAHGSAKQAAADADEYFMRVWGPHFLFLIS